MTLDASRHAPWLALLGAALVGAPTRAQEEEPFTLDGGLEAEADESIWEGLGENLRLNVDFVSRVDITRRHGEPGFLNAAGLDIRKVFSDESGDIGTLVLQPYLVRRDNRYERFVPEDGNDAFIFEAHDLYLDLTRWGRGRTNVTVGHFDVPFGLEPLVDTHFTMRQLIPMHDAGFKKDWGVSLNGVLPELDYEIALTRGTGMDLSDAGRDPYLVSGRLGTPSDDNLVLGVSALYGEVIDTHGGHRVDENDPRGETREPERFVRRWRVGLDATSIVEQLTFRGELSAGEDFDQAVFNTLIEVSWTSPDEAIMFWLQGVYLGQDGFIGWDEDVETRLGVAFELAHGVELSGQWTHEFLTWAENEGDEHLTDDLFAVQLRLRF